DRSVSLVWRAKDQLVGCRVEANPQSVTVISVFQQAFVVYLVHAAPLNRHKGLHFVGPQHPRMSHCAVPELFVTRYPTLPSPKLHIPTVDRSKSFLLFD